MRSSTSSGESIKEKFSMPFPILLIAIVMSLAVGLATKILEPSFIAGALLLVIIIALRQDELAATGVIVVSVYYDWYWADRVIALVIVVLLLVVFFLNRSQQRPWVEPRALWLWALFLALAIFPAIRGALTVHDAIIYYPSIILGAFIIFWLGTIVGRNTTSVRRLFQMLSCFGALVALHTIIQSMTGITLFESPIADSYLATVSNYQLTPDLDVYRLGSFFIDPNWNSTFLATILFIPLGLFVEASSFLAKVLYLGEALLLVLALLFTYSAGSWIAALVGMGVFVVLVGRIRYRIQLPLIIAAVAGVMLIGFPSQIDLLLQHASDPSELSLRNAVWQTALRVISAYPWTGVGLGHLAYLTRAEPFRVLGQYLPYDHPHNSYLEFGAMAGLPVLAVFLAILLFTLWLALRNWAHADVRSRSLIGAGIAAIIVLSVNSWSINGWTLPPIAATGWLIFGSISSPLLWKSLQRKESSSEKSSFIVE